MFNRRDPALEHRPEEGPRYAQPGMPGGLQPVMEAAPVTTLPTPVATAPAANPDESVIGREDSFDGTLRTSRGVRILGKVSGTIESGQYVRIEETAQVGADISAEEVVIAGEYAGKLNCRQRLEISATGRVSGEIDTVKLSLHEGGFIDGNLRMKRPDDVVAREPASAGESGKTAASAGRAAAESVKANGESRASSAEGRRESASRREPESPAPTLREVGSAGRSRS